MRYSKDFSVRLGLKLKFNSKVLIYKNDLCPFAKRLMPESENVEPFKFNFKYCKYINVLKHPTKRFNPLSVMLAQFSKPKIRYCRDP